MGHRLFVFEEELGRYVERGFEEKILDALRSRGLAILAGMQGVGKTRTALHIACMLAGEGFLPVRVVVGSEEGRVSLFKCPGGGATVLSVDLPSEELAGSVLRPIQGYAAAGDPRGFAREYERLLEEYAGAEGFRLDARTIIALLARMLARQVLPEEAAQRVGELLELEGVEALAGMVVGVLRRLRERGRKWRLLLVLDVYGASGSAESAIARSMASTLQALEALRGEGYVEVLMVHSFPYLDMEYYEGFLQDPLGYMVKIYGVNLGGVQLSSEIIVDVGAPQPG